MTWSYVALIIKDPGDTAYGVVFPDLAGCFSAGDSYEEAVRNARQALSLYCGVAREEGSHLPNGRELEVLRTDRALREEFGETIAGLVSVPVVPLDQTPYVQDEHQPDVLTGFKET